MDMHSDTMGAEKLMNTLLSLTNEGFEPKISFLTGMMHQMFYEIWSDNKSMESVERTRIYLNGCLFGIYCSGAVKHHLQLHFKDNILVLMDVDDNNKILMNILGRSNE